MNCTLESVCSFLNGGTPSTAIPRYYEGDIPWITGADITGPVADTARSFITEEAIRGSATNCVPAGTVLLVTRTSVGKVALAAMDLCFSQDITAITPDPQRLDTSYLVRFLQTKQPYLGRLARGATIKGVTREAVANLEIPLPPLSEQRRIAEILDRADALRTKRRAALAQLDTLTQSIFVDMFGDPATNPKGWPRVALTELCRRPEDIKCGPFGTQLAQSEYTTEGVPLWGIKNVNAFFRLPTHEFLEPGTAKRLSQYSIETGDIVMTRKGTVGKCAVYPAAFPPGIMHSDLLRVRVSHDRAEPAFVSHQLHHSRDVERQISLISGGAIMPGINVTKLKTLEVLAPPISIQREFADRVAAVDRLQATQESAIHMADAVFISIQHRAFRGELLA